MPKKKRTKKPAPQVDTTASAALDDAFSIAEELASELQSWFDNLPESFQNGSKGDALQTAIDALENAQRPDECPDGMGDTPIRYTPAGPRASRRDRLQIAINHLDELSQIANERADEIESENGDESNDDSEALRNFASECDDAKSEFESVEFPGMYG